LDLFVLQATHSRSTKTLSNQRARPMLIRTPAASNLSENAALVNRALLEVEDRWPPLPQSVVECVETGGEVHRVR
jgi:hypothetical protein